MKIIDTHIHTSFNREDFLETAKEIGNKFDLNELNKELRKNNIEYAVSITSDRTDKTPLEYERIIELTKKNKNIVGVLGINPKKIEKNSVDKIEEGIKLNLIKGLKIYPGYYYNYPNNKVYHKFYKLAEKYNVPVIIHCGDTYKKEALVKYAHPLNVDELAVKFPKVIFVIAHLGNPWIIDAAEVVYKNKNVYADLSGLFIGKIGSEFTKKKVLEALDYIDDYNKILYGSDWPLVNIKDYIKIIKNIVPKKYHKKVFYENAKKLFKL